ncbi:hypothetical protein [Piscinibacter sp.]|uniref:hypothetical protein n=1 Tax=Piscinibacter sp. TaxID=1903157 RepID=UPI002F404A34
MFRPIPETLSGMAAGQIDFGLGFLPSLETGIRDAVGALPARDQTALVPLPEFAIALYWPGTTATTATRPISGCAISWCSSFRPTAPEPRQRVPYLASGWVAGCVRANASSAWQAASIARSV